MPTSYTLTQLEPHAFEHMVVSLAMRELGAGVTGFGPGSDGGRDGYYEGEAPYPSASERWGGRWYLQAKFHAPHLSKNPQQWLIEQVQHELLEFTYTKNRVWPDNWIVITNIDPSGTPETGAFDRCRALVEKYRRRLAKRFDIWGGQKVLALLHRHRDIADAYGHFLTPGHVLTELYEALGDARAGAEAIVRHLIARQFDSQQYARLEQAGSASDARPGVHRLFIDIPFRSGPDAEERRVVKTLLSASVRSHRPSIERYAARGERWRLWHQDPHRARTWFVRGGPGQGKSTVTQFFAQMHRAWFLLQEDGPRVTDRLRSTAEDVRAAAERLGLWPAGGRIPLAIELKDYAQWIGERASSQPRGILSYAAARLTAAVEQPVLIGTLKRLLGMRSWFIAFDGLDEVPHDVKDLVAAEIRHFLDEVVFEADADVLAFCTSRPQGYSGQLADLDACGIELTPLTITDALECADPLLRFDRSHEEYAHSIQILHAATANPAVRELMTTPLQSHIMAIVVREGGKPPDRRWKLYNNFYQIIRRREANRELPDRRVARILRENERLLKTVHNRVGFGLHAAAETSTGAQSNMSRDRFQQIATAAVNAMVRKEVDSTVAGLMHATTERLVLVNTPDDSEHVRFDVRQLQEFFAAELLYEAVDATTVGDRLALIGSDSHWREVTDFLLSGLIENDRRGEVNLANSVLQRIDGDDSDGTRALRRRTAAGAASCVRLLAEGVLESDIRLLNDLRPAFVPVFGSSEASLLRPLVELRHPESLDWLRDTLVDSIEEGSVGENVGAAAVLACILPGDHPRFPVVRDFLLSAPVDFTAAVCRALDPPEQTPWTDWFLIHLLTLLRDRRMLDASGRAVRYIVKALSAHAERAKRLVVAVTRNPREEAMVEWLLSGKLSHSTASYGDIVLSVMKPLFTKSTPTPVTLRHASIEPEPQTLLALLHVTALFAAKKGAPQLRDLARVAGACRPELLVALPPHIQAEIPVPFDSRMHEVLTEMHAATPEDARSIIRHGRFGGRRLRSLVAKVESAGRAHPTRWLALVKDHLEGAAFIWATNRNDMLLRTSEYTESLIEALLENGPVLMSHAGAWGALIETCPSYEERLRRTALHWSGERPRPVAIPFVPMRLSLPAEQGLLPHLALPCVSSLSWRISELAPIHVLRDIRDDETAAVRDRLAAAIVAAVHSRGAGLREVENFRDLYTEEEGCWSALALTELLRAEKPTNGRARRLAADLITATRGNFRNRDLVDSLLAKWREASTAPITTAGIADQWLGLPPTP